MALTHLSCCRELLDVEVHEHGKQQHDAEEGLEPVGIPARVYDAQACHAEDEGTDRNADGAAVAAGHQGATHHRGDDVQELVPHTIAGLEDVEVVQVVHAGEPAEKPYWHEEADLDASDRHTDRAGRSGVS